MMQHVLPLSSGVGVYLVAALVVIGFVVVALGVDSSSGSSGSICFVCLGLPVSQGVFWPVASLSNSLVALLDSFMSMALSTAVVVSSATSVASGDSFDSMARVRFRRRGIVDC